MKQKMFFLLMLAAMLFVGCGDDDSNDGPNNNPSVATFDYSKLIDMSYSDMMKQYPNFTLLFGDFYTWDSVNNSVAGLTVAINSETQTIYYVMEDLNEEACKEADIDAHFKSKYKFYGVEQQDLYDDDQVVGKLNVYTYGNAEKQEDATLVITLSGNESITYTNPKNEPTLPEGPSLDDMTPIEAVNAFIFADLEEIEEDYPGVFTQMNGMYMCFMEENPWLSGIAFTPVNDFVTSITILYNDEKDDQAIIDYYKEQGYTCIKTGYDEDDEADIYTISNSEFSIEYCAGRGVVTYIGEID